jgi:hypothetical protein
MNTEIVCQFWHSHAIGVNNPDSRPAIHWELVKVT